jgi:hypothetical protein
MTTGEPPVADQRCKKPCRFAPQNRALPCNSKMARSAQAQILHGITPIGIGLRLTHDPMEWAALDSNQRLPPCETALLPTWIPTLEKRSEAWLTPVRYTMPPREASGPDKAPEYIKVLIIQIMPPYAIVCHHNGRQWVRLWLDAREVHLFPISE